MPEAEPAGRLADEGKPVAVVVAVEAPGLDAKVVVKPDVTGKPVEKTVSGGMLVVGPTVEAVVPCAIGVVTPDVSDTGLEARAVEACGIAVMSVEAVSGRLVIGMTVAGLEPPVGDSVAVVKLCKTEPASEVCPVVVKGTPETPVGTVADGAIVVSGRLNGPLAGTTGTTVVEWSEVVVNSDRTEPVPVVIDAMGTPPDAVTLGPATTGIAVDITDGMILL